MKTTINLRRHAARCYAAALVVASLVATSSCVVETSSPGGQNDDGQTTFTLQLPEAQSVATRAAGTPVENTIKSLTLLICNPNGGTLVSAINCTTTLASSDPSGNRWTFKASVPFNTAYDLLLVANATVPNTTAGRSRANLEADLRQSKTAGTEWSVTGATAATSIPMFGELRNKTFSGSYTPEPIPLRRMLARVNVNVAPAAQSAFKLTGVYVYNYNLSGNLLTPNNYVPTTPYIPSGVSESSSTSYLEWATPTDNTKSENQVYIFERAKGVKYPASGWADAPCIVVRGTYNGVTNQYYRLDFVSGDTPLDIVRNHSYNFNISSVSGPGYTSLANARASVPANMSADVLAWNDTDLSGINVGGQIYTVTTSATNGTAVANYSRALNGMKITVAAVPANGYKFTGWSAPSALVGKTDNPATFTISSNTTVTPTFAVNQEAYPINNGNIYNYLKITYTGSNEPITEAVVGSSVTITYINNESEQKYFKEWRLNWDSPAPVGFDPDTNPLTIQMPAGSFSIGANVYQPSYYGEPDVSRKSGIILFDGVTSTPYLGDQISLTLQSFDPNDDPGFRYKAAFFKYGSIVGLNNYYTQGIYSSDPSVDPNNVTFNPMPEREISYYSDIAFYSDNDNQNELTDISYNTYENYRIGKGDPCQILGLSAGQLKRALSANDGGEKLKRMLDARPDHFKGWIMPSYYSGYDELIGGGASYPGAVVTDWKERDGISLGYFYFSPNGIYLPALGYIDPSGYVNQDYSSVSYWGGSNYDEPYVITGNTYTDPSEIYWGRADNREGAYPIRCSRNGWY